MKTQKTEEQPMVIIKAAENFEHAKAELLAAILELKAILSKIIIILKEGSRNVGTEK